MVTDKTRFGLSIILLVVFTLLIPAALSIPPIPTEFYGTATVYNYNRTPLAVGTRINIFSGNISCGSFDIVNAGYYGVLSCLGDDNYTMADEGAEFGQNILFYIGNETAQVFGDTVWYYGEYHMVNLTPVPRCGNGLCELTDSCITCAEDCGRCPQNTSGNGTTGGGGPGGGGGGGGGGAAGGGGGGASGGGGGGGGGEGYTGAGQQNQSLAICQEDWLCTAWFPDICSPEGLQRRTCSDRNSCNTTLKLPELNQTCEYSGTCYDIIENQDETDVDCGGLKCGPCDTGKKCLFDFDCKSGFCDPVDKVCKEPTCNDNFKNHGEQGVDCGGPCPPCERPSIEKPGTIAIFMITGCGPFPWIFVLAASLVTLLIYIAGKSYIEKVKHSRQYRKLRKVEQMNRIYRLERNLRVFVLLIILLEIAISLYWYYLCEIDVWIALMVLIIIPLAVSIVIKSYVYDEKRKKKKLRNLILGHEDYLKRMIKIERDEIKKEEQKAYMLLTDEIRYSGMDKKLAVILKDVRYLLEELHETKDDEPLEQENSLTDTISSLDAFKESIDNDETLKHLYSLLKTIEKIHRDILQQYKKLNEDKDIEKELGPPENPGEGKDASARESADASSGTSAPQDEGNKNSEGKSSAPSAEIMPSPAEKPNYAMISKKLSETRNSNEREDLINKLHADFPADDNVSYLTASCYHRNSDFGKAEKIYRDILTRSPNDKKVIYSLASLCNQHKNFTESLRLYEKIMGIDPGYLNTRKYYEELKNRKVAG